MANRSISRRDFLHGVGAAAAGLAVGSARAGVGPVRLPADPSDYPPLRSGLRGSHGGSFEVAHQLALEGRRDWGPVDDPDPHAYDLVIVGAGVSGLAAAFFFQERRPDARILLLENHDDFGGHARRNEFRVGDRTVIGYGGSQTMESPSDYSDVAKRLLRELAVDLDRFESAYDQDFYRRHGLGPAIFFDRATYGVDRLVRCDLFDASLFVPIPRADVPHAQAVARMPLGEATRKELVGLLEMSEDRLPDHSFLSEGGYLRSISYEKFLVDHLGVRSTELIELLRDLPSPYFGLGTDAVPAMDMLALGLPGLRGTSLRHFEALIRGAVKWFTEPYIHHFPDGNASIARLLVRRLVPGVAPGETMEDVVTAPFDYSRLDLADSPVRLRLGSTVVNVVHEGTPAAAQEVTVTYVRSGRAERVRAKQCVLACYNMAIPHLCPELPAAQRAALKEGVKVPLVYTTVLVRSWRPFKELGVGVAHCPGSWHRLAMLDFPVSLGQYRYPSDPDEPALVHLQRVPSKPGATPKEQHRAGRRELLTTPFETIEASLRTQLGGMFGSAGFDPDPDILGITVNRWPHGYAYGHNPLFDPEYAPGEAPHELGRRRFGRLAIANSDAGGRAYLDCAIDEAWRAIGELLG